MTKAEKMKALVKYQALLEARQNSALPEKHKTREKTYKAFLVNELATVKSQITQLKEATT